MWTVMCGCWFHAGDLVVDGEHSRNNERGKNIWRLQGSSRACAICLPVVSMASYHSSSGRIGRFGLKRMSVASRRACSGLSRQWKCRTWVARSLPGQALFLRDWCRGAGRLLRTSMPSRRVREGEGCGPVW